MLEPIMVARNISKSFGALRASDDVSIDLYSGEIHALIGPNGAGKSTLIKQLCGNLTPDEGRIFLDNNDITALNTAERARLGFARTFQISALAMEYTVLQNAVLGALGASQAVMRFWKPVMQDQGLVTTAQQALERVGLIEQQTAITATLSHGQRRQLEVAIALTLKPRLFLMDEPMAGLGLEGSKDLTQFLKELREEAPILLVEHDMDAVFTLADRISVLVNGRIIATDSPENTRINPVVQQAYLGDEMLS